jgi:hypothetical protein
MRFGIRLVVAIVVAAAFVAGGWAMERVLGPRPPRSAAASEEVSGGWYCPHGGGEGWRAWITVANPSSRPTQVRVTTWAGPTPQTTGELLQPRTHRTVEVPAGLPAAASVVEYIGAPAAAGMVITRPEAQGGGVAAEPCSDRPGTRWYVPEGSTLRGETDTLILHNPFATDAVVDVALVSSRRVLRPGRLRGIVLSPGRVRAFDLGRFALDEDALTAVVTAPLGRVSAAGVTTSAGGVRATVAVPGFSRRWIVPGAGDGAGALVITAPENRPVPFHARAQTADTQSAVVDLETVAAGTALGFDEGAREAGVVAEADGPVGFLAARRLAAAQPPAREEQPGGRPGQRGRNRQEEPPPRSPSDLAATAGSPVASSSWVVLPPVGPDGGPVVVLVQNPGTRPAEVEITPLGLEASGEAQSLTVPPRTTARVDLPQPAAALVRSASMPVVAAGTALGHRTYAVAVGIPLGAVPAD